jgi:hypothetical protein
LGRIFEPKREKERGNRTRENYIVRSFILYTLSNIIVVIILVMWVGNVATHERYEEVIEHFGWEA